MELTVTPLELIKRYPLTISRGTVAASNNLLIRLEQDGIVGYGEFAPVSQVTPPETAVTARAAVENLAPLLQELSPWDAQTVERLAMEQGMGRAAYCAVDTAIHDWQGKRTGTPVYRLLGGDRSRIVVSSITIGINPPAVVRERTAELISRLAPRALKIKLGSPEGIEADKEMFAAIQEVAPGDVALRVDANGGWRTVPEARGMMQWLADRGVEYVEQPLAKGRESELPHIFEGRPLPLFVDESCGVAADVPGLADRADGVNLKLMKSGGIREGMRLIHTARAHGLAVMIGCMSESSLAIAAGAALAPYADHIDLDSHLNLLNDPFHGLGWRSGKVVLSDAPGLGIEWAGEGGGLCID